MLDRKAFMGYFSAMGMAGTLFPGVLWARMQEAREVTKEILADAEKVAGLEFSDEEREMMLRGLNSNLEAYAAIREVPIPNSVVPAVIFEPSLPWHEVPTLETPLRMTREQVERPRDLEQVAFWPVTKLSALIRTGQVTSVELTEMYLGRLREHGPRLEAVITLTDDLAMRQARRADADFRAGRYRGPLHGIPWGAKDLLAARSYKTTWGAEPYVDQVLEEDATVVRRLEDAGAVLVAKLTLGALAMGDYWFGGRTRNPWDLEQGSSGSSAGSAAATTAGLVGFAIGSETLGSIVSPSTRTGASGLRPTFGRVSRAGAMALSWTMDKLGPLCRSAEDCALVLDAIHGRDGVDPTARTVPFNWDAEQDLSDLRIGYFKSAFEEERDNKAFDDATVDVFRRLGVDLIPVELPDSYPLGALRVILSAEASAAFDELTRSGRDELLTRQTAGSWPNSFRTARMIPAVEYLQANRVRTMVMGAMDAAMEGIDVFLTPSYGGGPNNGVLLMTNLTGHPAVVVPNGFTEGGTPVSTSFIGKLWGDAEALRVAKAFQDATDFNRRTPPLFAVSGAGGVDMPETGGVMRPVNRRRRRLLLALVLFAPSCGDDPELGESSVSSDVGPPIVDVASGVIGEVAALAVTSGGVVVVADPLNDAVHLFDSTGAAVARIGREGSGPGEFRRPRALAVVSGRILVLDEGNGRIQEFTEAGEYVGSTPTPPAPRGGYWALSPDGRVVAPTLGLDSALLKIFGPDGEGRRLGTVAGTPSRLLQIRQMKSDLIAGEIPTIFLNTVVPFFDDAGGLWLVEPARRVVERYDAVSLQRSDSVFLDFPEANRERDQRVHGRERPVGGLQVCSMVTAGVLAGACVSVPESLPGPESLVARAIDEIMLADGLSPDPMLVDDRLLPPNTSEIPMVHQFRYPVWHPKWRELANRSGWGRGDIIEANRCNPLGFLGFGLRIFREGEPEPPMREEDLELMRSCGKTAKIFTLAASPPTSPPGSDRLRVRVLGRGGGVLYAADVYFSPEGLMEEVVELWRLIT